MSRISMIQEPDNLSFDDAFALFIRKCEIKNLTPNSIKSYKMKIRPFREFCYSNNVLVKQITKDTVDDFILWARKNTEANDISINSYLRAVRAFTYFCMDNGYIERFKVSLPKAVKKTKETYSEAELELLLKKPNVKNCGFSEFKIWAFENFLVGTGVRLSTAVNIKIQDVNFDSGFVFLGVTKNRTQQYIPLAKSLSEILKEYLKYRKGSGDDYLFCNSFGNKADNRTYQQMVANYNRDRGVMRTSIHAFRHTFAKLFILNGGDAFRLQKLMGHSNIAVTKEYVDLFGTDLANGYDKFNPLDNLNSKKDKISMTATRTSY